jgi:hypothetical protein
MRRITIPLLLLLLAGLLWSHAPVAAQSAGWSAPFPVSDINKTPTSWFPDIAIGPAGSVHIVWSSGLPGKKKEDAGRDLLLYRELRDGKWSSINDIDTPGEGGYTVRNSIIMGRDGNLHVLVREGLYTSYMSAPWERAWSANAWSAPRHMNGGGAYFNALAMDSKGALHVTWNEAIPDDPQAPKPACSFCADLFYRRSADGGKSWSAPINLSQSPEGSVKQQVAIDKGDNIHVVWEEGFDWYASMGDPVAGMYRRSRDGGRSWDKPVRFTLPPVPAEPPDTAEPNATPAPPAPPTPDAPRQVTIGLYQNAAPIVVYRSNVTDNIYYQLSEDGGGAWSKPAIIPGIRARSIRDTDHDDYTMATDGAGNVHLVCAGFLSNDTDPASSLKLLHLVWNGRGWSRPEVIAASDAYPTIDMVTRVDGERLPIFPEWPRAVISGDTLHVTWFTRNERDLFTSDNAHYQVWYSARRVDGPAIAPLALFTPVPTAAPATPTAQPTLVPTPALAPDIIDASPIDGAAAWEGPGIVAVGLAMLAVAALLGLVVLARALAVRRRRPSGTRQRFGR